MPSSSHDQIRRLRLRAQRLDRRPLGSVTGVAQVTRDICGVQAQDPAAAALAIRARSAELVASDVDRARVQERSVVRTWAMRGTLHLLATDDLGWLLPLLGPIFVAESRRRRAELGLDEDTTARGVRALRAVLADQGPLTRAQVVEQLSTHGIRLEGQARPHLLRQAALQGAICALGIWRSNRRRDRLDVVVEPFDHLTDEARSGLEAEVTDFTFRATYSN